MPKPVDDNGFRKNAIRSRLDLIKALENSRFGRQMFLGLMDIELKKATYEQAVNSETLRQATLHYLTESDTYGIENELRDIVNASWSEFPAIDLTLEDTLSTHGYVYFETPIERIDMYGTAESLRALSWVVQKADDDDVIHMGIPEDRYIITLLAYMDSKDLFGDVPEGFPIVYPVTSAIWELETTDGGFLQEVLDPFLPMGDGRLPYMKLLLSTWAAVRSVLTEEVPTREHRQKSEVTHLRKRHPKFNDEIKVIRMRRKSQREGGRPSRRFELPDDPEMARKALEDAEDRLTDAKHWTWSKRVAFGWTWRTITRKATGKREAILISPHDRGPKHLPIERAHKLLLPPKPRNPSER